jgi:hypothetical protein
VTDFGLLARQIHAGVISVNEAREMMGLPPFGWPLNMPPAAVTAPARRTCSYCKSPGYAGRCKNCGAPQ